MGFFAEYSAWLDRVLANYVSDTVAALANVLEPAILTAGILYVMIWGYLQLTGKVDEPFTDGVKRILVLALVFAASLHLWMYNELIVDTFYSAPSLLTARLLGETDPVRTVDAILRAGFQVAQRLLQKGSIFSNNISFFIAGFLVYVTIGLTTVYTIFLLSLSKIALSILLALGPGFFALLLFSTTRRFFEAWLAQLANYAFIAVLIVLAAALMLHLIRTSAAQAVSMGPDVQIAHAIRVSMTAVVAFLIMRQVMPIAASLASGLSLSTFGLLSGAMSDSLSRSLRSGRDFTRGMINPRGYTAYSTISGRIGAGMSHVVSGAHRRVARRWHVNSIRAVR